MMTVNDLIKQLRGDDGDQADICARRAHVERVASWPSSEAELTDVKAGEVEDIDAVTQRFDLSLRYKTGNRVTFRVSVERIY